MRIKDIPEVMKLGKASPANAVTRNTSFWLEKELEGWLTHSLDPMLIAEVEGKIVGFCLARVHHPTKNAILENLLVIPKYRNKGIGTQLLNKCLRELRKQRVTYVYGLAHFEDVPSIEFMVKNSFTKGYNFIWLEKDLTKK